MWFSISLVTLPIARGRRLPVALLAKSKGCSCKLPEKPWQLRQSLSSSEAQLLCSGWRRRQQSAHISKLSRHGAACCVAGKEGPLDGPNQGLISRMSGEECGVGQGDRSSREPV